MRACVLLVLLSAALLNGQTAPDEASGRASMSGVVLNAVTGEPVRKATVTLQNDGDLTRSIQTDVDGTFQFADLPPGEYQLTVSQPSFVAFPRSTGRGRSHTSIYKVAAGQKLKDVAIRLLPAAVIRGKVTDADGDPVADASVEVLDIRASNPRKAFSSIRSEWAGVGRTNDRGEYRVYGIAPGRYYVQVQSGSADELPDLHVAGKQPYLPTYYPNSIELQNASVVELTGGEELGIDIALQRGKLFLIRGTAKTAFGPVKQGFITVISGMRPVAMQEIADGKFELHLPAGDYTVVASEYNKNGETGSPRNAYCMQPFNVGEGASTLDLSLNRPARAGKITGLVETESGQPLPKVRAYVALVPLLKESRHFDLNDLIYSGLTSSAGSQVDDQGKFVLTDAKPGTFEVAFQAANMDDWFVKAVYANGRDIRDTGLQVSAAPVDLEIVVSPNGASVSGIVKDAAGSPVADAFVLLAPTDGRSKRMSAFGNATTDENGAYTIRGLEPGDYAAFAWDDIDDDEWMDPSRLKRWADHGTKVSMSVGEKLRLNPPLIVTSGGTSPE